MDTDSSEYEILKNAVTYSKGIDGMTCEIGVRSGGSTKIIIDELLATDQNKVHVAIDPFGNIEYVDNENRKGRSDYTNKMKTNMLKNIYTYCSENDMDVLFFPMEDTEFFARFKDGIPVYNECKMILNTYSMVFFDGPHNTFKVKEEFDFFKDKIPVGGTIVFDDINTHPHMQILDPYILQNNFRLLQKGQVKVSYIKYKY